ncbi:MAG TPA: hypothetical protein VH196_10480, partial [Terriglobales bacterium]|jgi:hypothetical protein|nr:hypothetical protein [Terriglobales bacterium]
MILYVAVAVLLISGAAVLVTLLRGSIEHPSNLSELLDRLQPVNIASFRHLASDTDDRYLRQNLSVLEYVKLRSSRLKTIQSYYLSAFRNCSILLSYGELLSNSEHRLFAEFGRELSSSAMELRLALLRAIAGVCLCYLVPVGVPLWREITDSYSLLGSRLSHFSESNFPDLQPAIIDQFWL